MLGYTGTYTPVLVSVYNDTAASQKAQSSKTKAVGTNDSTLGVAATTSSLNAVTNGITFFASDTSATYGQVARAVALYDDNNVVVASDGENSTSSNSSIFMTMFDNDGLFNPDFGSSGQATVLQGSDTPVTASYENQYVTDMVSFQTTAGVHKAILSGYVYNATLGQYASLLL